MEGGSLYSKLNVLISGQRLFGWQYRGKQVALAVAKGLHYLHSFSVTHFDCKSANILLTANLHAKIADVGLARQALAGFLAGPCLTMLCYATLLVVLHAGRP